MSQIQKGYARYVGLHVSVQCIDLDSTVYTVHTLHIHYIYTAYTVHILHSTYTVHSTLYARYKEHSGSEEICFVHPKFRLFNFLVSTLYMCTIVLLLYYTVKQQWITVKSPVRKRDCNQGCGLGLSGFDRTRTTRWPNPTESPSPTDIDTGIHFFLNNSTFRSYNLNLR